MQIYQYLKDDHKQVSELFSKILKDTRNSSRKKTQDKIFSELLLHAKSEQHTFYRKLKRNSKNKDIVEHAIKEHADITKGIKKLSKIELGTDDWQDAIEELKKTVEHHVKEEESKIFKMASKIISDEDAQILVDQMKAYKKKILSSIKEKSGASKSKKSSIKTSNPPVNVKILQSIASAKRL